MTLQTLLIWLGIITLLSAVLDFILKNIFHGYSYRIFVAPGVIIHELAHAVACLTTGAKVKEISFFDKKGGFVKHEKPKLPYIGPVIISSAPLIAGILLIFLIAKMILLQPVAVSFSADPGNFKRVLSSLGNIKLASIRNFIAFYILLSVSVTMTPSMQDAKNAFVGSLFVLAVLLTINYFFVIKLPESQIILALGLVSLILILGILFSIILALIRSVLSFR